MVKSVGILQVAISLKAALYPLEPQLKHPERMMVISRIKEGIRKMKKI